MPAIQLSATPKGNGYQATVTFPDGVSISSAETYPTIGEAMTAAALKLLGMAQRLEATRSTGKPRQPLRHAAAKAEESVRLIRRPAHCGRRGPGSVRHAQSRSYASCRTCQLLMPNCVSGGRMSFDRVSKSAGEIVNDTYIAITALPSFAIGKRLNQQRPPSMLSLLSVHMMVCAANPFQSTSNDSNQ
jgi:hypothetical protein